MRARSVTKNFGFGLIMSIAGLGGYCVSSSASADTSGIVAVDLADAAGLSVRSNALEPTLLAAGSPQLNSVARLSQGGQLQTVIPSASFVMQPTAFANSMPSGRSAESAPPRSRSDRFLLLLVGITLIGYQLLRKHRLLRPQPFSL